jgi:uncharacterized membrane protein YkvA (DUF1232 family)
MQHIDPKYSKYFSVNSFWKKISSGARGAGLKIVYAALLLYHVMQDSETPREAKIIVLSALGYFILPLDLIPDFIPLGGLTDDLGALLLAVSQISASVKPIHKEKAKQKCYQLFGHFAEEEVSDFPV